MVLIGAEHGSLASFLCLDSQAENYASFHSKLEKEPV